MNNLVDLEYYDKMYHIRKKLIIKHNISSFHLLDSLKNTVYTNDITCETHLVSCFNENYVFVIIGEQCMVLPKLCASRWGYLEAIINRWNDDITFPIIINITHLLLDSNILTEVSYKRLIKDILRCLYESRINRIYGLTKTDVEYYKPFLQLLIPPKNYWEPVTTNNGFGLWTPSTHLFTPTTDTTNDDTDIEQNVEQNL
jgi:hypothetical protein|tara:strand:- start:36 stop:635 length:600 start_codon:yes stop_codon:yes gene_type:complete